MNTKLKLLSACLITSSFFVSAFAQGEQQTPVRRASSTTASTSATPARRYEADESVREDKFTGGKIETAEFAAGQPDIKITVDVPAFRLTLWQNGKEVKVYKIGVGMKKYPLVIGERKIEDVIWNPAWVPPDSDWVSDHAGVSVGEVIPASDPRNPLGKVKMPLGGGYLIHEAHGVGDWGNLVSHGCVRMVRSDLYDLAEKIIAARSLPVSAKKIANAKRTKNTLDVKLDTPLPIDINYDTQVVEGNTLHLYADVYGRGTNTVERMRAELSDYQIDQSAIDDPTIKKLLSLPTRQRQYVVSLDSLKAGRALEDGHLVPIIPSTPAKRKPAPKKTTRPA
ncbi:MAG: L,D-transpeptidase ErfK/SrfK [Acidobacteriota bacterium]|nr:L,D-transpeptidase ErfK/SrfK [Acidobacteriota bacterium]